ncbi:MAG TPA: EAL domain-containing protein, partial [Thermoanaerobaculia bacterium]|nr:EAL domain-containing protein [Thermoanaerobaculia bacterium]
SADSYHLDGLAVATAVVALLTLLIGVVILIRGRGSRPTTVYFVITLAAGGWLGGFALLYASMDPAVALFWARAAHLPAYLVPAAIFQFAVLQHGRRRQLTLVSDIVWIVFAVAGTFAAATPFVVPRVVRYPWGYYPVANGATVAMVIAAFLAMVAAVVTLWDAYRQGEGRAQERAGSLILACVLGCLGFADFLPMIGFDIYPVGYMAMLAFVMVSGTTLWRYRLVDLTPEYAASQIMDTMKSAVLVIDMDGKIRVVNRTATVMLGYTAEELVGASVRKILDPDENISTKKLLNSTGVLEQQLVWRTASGARADVLASSSFVRDSEGTPVGVVYVASDFTERRRAEGALRESEHRYRTLFDANPLPMWVYDFETLKFIAVNDVAVQHYGYSRDEFLQMRITDIRPQEDVPEVMALLPLLTPRKGPTTFRHTKKDGAVIDVEISSFEFESGGRKARLVIAHDITERRRAEQRLRESEARYRLLFERNLAGVYRTSTSGQVLDCNDAFARIFGFPSREEMLDSTAVSLYFDAEDRNRLINTLRDQKALTNVEARMRRVDGTAVWVLENMTLLDGMHGQEVIEGTVIDITDRKSAQQEIEYQAYHDMLTGLPNRLLFTDRIGVALAHARRTSRTVAVMFLDLDVFKTINDTLGHAVGDRLLQAISVRLVNSVRAEDTVARIGGDEFTVLLSDVADARGAATVARKILDAVSLPVLVEGHELHVTTSIGIALYPGDGFDAEALLKSADRAMYRAKQLGRNNYQYSTPPPADDRHLLERRLKQAFERNELTLHYQPIVDLASGRINSVEALLRWNDPVRGMLLPDAFVPLAEESTLIVQMGDWVLRTACAQVRRWHAAGHTSLRVAVNLSARQFQQRDLPAMVARILENTGASPTALEVEITESTAMYNAELSLATMTALREMGVRISIDDFGTGYSSLSYLKRFPIDTVKIDHEFVRNLTTDANDQAIIAAVVSMARALKLRVVAEGVETEEQLAFLRREGCTDMQGYLHSRPAPAADFERAFLGGVVAEVDSARARGTLSAPVHDV